MTIALVEPTSKQRKMLVMSHSTLDWKLKARSVSANRRPTMMKIMIWESKFRLNDISASGSK